MSGIMWATTNRCDVPGCENTATVELDKNVRQPRVADGWINFPATGCTFLTRHGTAVNDICPDHAEWSLATLVTRLVASEQ